MVDKKAWNNGKRKNELTGELYVVSVQRFGWNVDVVKKLFVCVCLMIWREKSRVWVFINTLNNLASRNSIRWMVINY